MVETYQVKGMKKGDFQARAQRCKLTREATGTAYQCLKGGVKRHAACLGLSRLGGYGTAGMRPLVSNERLRIGELGVTADGVVCAPVAEPGYPLDPVERG